MPLPQLSPLQSGNGHPRMSLPIGFCEMTREQFDAYCRGFQGVSHVVQWGNSSVWKVGGKIFAIHAIWGAGDHGKISFKCSDLSFSILCEQPGIVPAPYLARAKWVQITSDDAMSTKDLKAYIREAYQLIARKLPRAMRQELNLELD